MNDQQVAIISGASIGRATAIALANQGVRILIAARGSASAHTKFLFLLVT
jgi:NAD(P)-dependent dehydrogenase (short-subunit alcohol dehydrogenase family)